MRENDRDQVKLMLKERIIPLCEKLLPVSDKQTGRHGRLWISYNPVRGDFDASTPELKVGLNRDVGAWKCWRSGDKGDVLGLIEYVLRCDFHEAMNFARDFVGLRNMAPSDRQRLAAQMKIEQRQSDEKAEMARLASIRNAERKWLSADAFDGPRSASELHARRYLASRLCSLDDVLTIDWQTFRFHAASEYWRLAEYISDAAGRRYKVADGPLYPAIHSAMRGPTGIITACHVTFLDPLEPKKISLGKAHASKLMLGEARGAVIRISHGPEGLPPETAREKHPLVLCEGIETGLSLAIAIPECRVWAAGSLSNMGNAPVYMDCVGSIILARDNNFGNDQAQSQLDAVLEQLMAAGKPLEVIASHLGDDFNDLAKGEA